MGQCLYLCRYRVVADFGPWQAGTWVVWDQKAEIAPIVAMHDPHDPSSVCGVFPHRALPKLFQALETGCLVLEAISDDCAAYSTRLIRDATDFTGASLSVAS